jgi:sterol desaturase/sphingolipid hydroxylase (fatty acid hydroxylase superfamily)
MMSGPVSFLASGLTAATWPVGWLVALAADAASPPPPPGARSARDARGSPHATLLEHVGMQLGCVPRLALAAFLYAYVVGDWRAYAAVWAWPWVARIAARNVALAWFVGGVTDFLLLANESPFRGSSQRHKYSEQYPRFASSNGTAPVLRDIFWSTVSALVAAGLEAAGLHAYATGRVVSGAASDAEWWRHWPTVLLMLTWPYTQNVQFYCLHRFLHKWGTTSVPDLGALLYKHVHSLHHKAKNPTAFSGIAMHPVESALYFSYALFPLLFGAHPIAMTYIFLNLHAAAMLGHAGFEFPSQGSQPHFLHHSLVLVNFAENHLPLDLLFGTFAADAAEAEESMGRRFPGTAAAAAAAATAAAKAAAAGPLKKAS